MAFSVFMLAVAEKMPETSGSIPLIGKKSSLGQHQLKKSFTKSFKIIITIGEKIVLGVTVLLAFSVFMRTIAEKMPETSVSIPLIGKKWIYISVLAYYFRPHLPCVKFFKLAGFHIYMYK